MLKMHQVLQIILRLLQYTLTYLFLQSVARPLDICWNAPSVAYDTKVAALYLKLFFQSVAMPLDIC